MSSARQAKSALQKVTGKGRRVKKRKGRSSLQYNLSPFLGRIRDQGHCDWTRMRTVVIGATRVVMMRCINRTFSLRGRIRQVLAFNVTSFRFVCTWDSQLMQLLNFRNFCGRNCAAVMSRSSSPPVFPSPSPSPPLSTWDCEPFFLVLGVAGAEMAHLTDTSRFFSGFLERTPPHIRPGTTYPADLLESTQRVHMHTYLVMMWILLPIGISFLRRP